MKNLLTCFLIFFISYSNAQPYISMLEESNQWDTVHWSYWSGGYVAVNEITIIGEEIINGKTYKVIYKDGVTTNCRLREENGVVYSYEQQLNDEKIMLDLNVEIGDVIEEDNYCMGGGGGSIWEYKVTDVYVDFVAGEDRKVVVIEGFDILGDSFGYEEWWIEGIGSTNGLVPFGYNYDFYNLMTCFKNNDQFTYWNGFNTCYPALGINDLSLEEIILYPNPVINQSTLKLPVEASVNQITVLDMNGRIIKNETITKEYYKIDVMDYRSGIYFYKVFSDEELIKTAQFIVK
ncbi:MAG: hypothetical protein ACI83B_001334 [Sediminicola sp.]|jgi:hypothetical protein